MVICRQSYLQHKKLLQNSYNENKESKEEFKIGSIWKIEKKELKISKRK